MPMKNPSSVALRNRSRRKNGCQTWGSLLNAHIPKNAVRTDIRIVVSNAIGTLLGVIGRVHSGLPDTFHCHAIALQYHCRSAPPTVPHDAAEEDDPGQDRALDPHRLVDAVHRERAVAVELGEAGVVDLLGRRHQLARGVELGEDAVELAVLVAGGRVRAASPSPLPPHRRSASAVAPASPWARRRRPASPRRRPSRRHPRPRPGPRLPWSRCRWSPSSFPYRSDGPQCALPAWASGKVS